MPGKKKTQDEPKKQEPDKELSLEEAFVELDSIISGLEEDNITLEHSFKLYHKGIDLLKHCNSSIDKIEKELIILEESGV